MQPNEISGRIVETVVTIHRELGPGLLESVYHRILTYELKKQNLQVESECPIEVLWDGQRMDLGFRADLIVEQTVLVELKSVEKLAPVHSKQVLTYLKVGGYPLGLLLNFGDELMKKGIIRLVNRLPENM